MLLMLDYPKIASVRNALIICAIVQVWSSLISGSTHFIMLMNLGSDIFWKRGSNYGGDPH